MKTKKYKVIGGRGELYGVAEQNGAIVYDLLDTRAEARAIRDILNRGISPSWTSVSAALAANPKTRKWAEGGAA